MERYSSEGDCDSRQELNRLFFKLNIRAQQMFLSARPARKRVEMPAIVR